MKTPSLRLLSGLATALALNLVPSAFANVRLPAIFSEHMVLQQDVTVPVWGWADPGEEVTVTVGGQTKSTKANAEGKWSVQLAKLKSGEAVTLTVKGKNTLTVKDVLVCEVWLCSGQSNMGFTVNRANNFEQEKAAANFPSIRVFTVSSSVATTPQSDCVGRWSVCTPATVGSFSATAYFFGREIHKTTGRPVGLINSSVGGTPIESWTSWDAQKDKGDLKVIFDRWEKEKTTWDPAKAQAAYETQQSKWKVASAKAKEEKKTAPRAPQKPVEPRLNTHYPANLFNGKIAPLIPFAIRGAIWYQGESNATLGHLYHLQLTTMIQDWRKRWGYDFPFGWVQLPDFKAPQKEAVEHTGWVMVREGMLKSLSLPKTGMAVALGLGEANDIHPTNKQDVGKRLASWALADVYQQKGFAACGPLPAGHKVSGKEVEVSFKHTDGGLVAKDGELKGFAIAGADKKWVRATAKIQGTKVVVSSPEVTQPVAVRYAWADNPAFNLYNGAGLPASPFRTDDWK
jgi:sialate O-acetylesterase